MLSPMVAGKLPLRWHELVFFQVLRKNMGWLWKKTVFHRLSALFFVGEMLYYFRLAAGLRSLNGSDAQVPRKRS